MKRAALRRAMIAAALITSFATIAHASEASLVPNETAPSLLLPELSLYKGVVGNALELLPLEPDVRVDLQRVNAVVSSPLSGRSLALLLGISSPVLIIPGLVWGIWSALNIKVPKPDTAKWLGSRRVSLGFCARERLAKCSLPVEMTASAADDVQVVAAASEDTETGARISQAELSLSR